MTLAQKWDFSLYGYLFDIYEGWACPSMSLGAKDDIWTYLVLNSVNIKYYKVLGWSLSVKRDINIYIVANLINEKVEFVPWFKTWYVNLFSFVFGKMKVLERPLRKNEILVYMVICLIYMKVELVHRCPLVRKMIFEPILF